MTEQQISAEQIKKKGKKGALIVALAIILALALGLGAGRYFSKNKNANNAGPSGEQVARDRAQGAATATAGSAQGGTAATGGTTSVAGGQKQNQPTGNTSNNSSTGTGVAGAGSGGAGSGGSTGQNPAPPPGQNPPAQNPGQQPPAPEQERPPAPPNITISHPASNSEVGNTFDVIGHSKIYGSSLASAGDEIMVSVQSGGVAYFSEVATAYSPNGPGALEPGLWGDFSKKINLAGSLTDGQTLILYVFYYDQTKKLVSDTVSVPLKYKNPNAPPQVAPPSGQQTLQPGMINITSTTFDPVLLQWQLNP
ncbi:hypothetical protein EPN28_02275 [Patescibacteria group bacterium]|nr:MAG: hypothetical protein EPN28_02275 [Patescibacteria group bacterium]